MILDEHHEERIQPHWVEMDSDTDSDLETEEAEQYQHQGKRKGRVAGGGPKPKPRISPPNTKSAKAWAKTLVDQANHVLTLAKQVAEEERKQRVAREAARRKKEAAAKKAAGVQASEDWNAYRDLQQPPKQDGCMVVNTDIERDSLGAGLWHHQQGYKWQDDSQASTSSEETDVEQAPRRLRPADVGSRIKSIT